MRFLLFAVLLTLLAPAAATTQVFGHSTQGRGLEVTRIGDPAAPVRVLVVGSIHGDERAGQAVIARLRQLAPSPGVQAWIVRTVNPDGVLGDTRQNARGVDLNRNFPFRWCRTGRAFDTYFPGRAPASERETRAVERLVTAVRPQLTVWYHQHLRLVSLERDIDNAPVRAYARRVGLPARWLPYLRGTATTWQNHAFPGTTAFVVELPAGALSRRAAERHARAVLALAAPAAAAVAAAAPKPTIRWKRIPFGADRTRQMRAYSKRHYGVAEAALIDPKVIVEHYTATSSFSSAWNTFASNAPDVELHERPGVCAHFIVDRDGTIYQLVSLTRRCRHTVGLNDSAIGIEHVGSSDADVMGRPRQLAASLRLTRWLQGRYGILERNVIGHAESLSSPYHHERLRGLRNQTHGDFQHATMQRYRSRL